MKLFFTATIFLFNSIYSIAQSTFQKLYGNVEYDWCNGVVRTSGGDYCMLGTNGYSEGSRNVLLYMVDRDGNLLWTSEIGTNEMEYPTDMIETPDGGFAITGFTDGVLPGTNTREAFILKTDSSGNLEFMRTFLSGNYTRGEKIILNPTGGYYIFGSTYNSGFGSIQGIVIKIDGLGNQLWSNISYAATANHYFTGTIISNGSLIAAGYCSTPSNDFVYNNFISQFDTSGNLIWSKRYSNGDEGNITDIIPSANGGFIALSDTKDSVSQHITLSNYDSSGSIQWSNRYLSTSFSSGMSIARSSNQDLLVCGRTSVGINSSLALIARFNANGQFILANAYGDPTEYSNAMDIVEGDESSIVISGDFTGLGVFNSQTYLVKSDSLANSGCHQTSVNFNADPISFTDSSGGNSVLITMQDTLINPNVQTFINNGSVNCFNVSISSIENSNLSVHPNPTSGLFKVQVSEYGNHVLELYNVTGQKVMQTNFGQDFVNLDPSNYLPGVYYFRVDNSKGGKLILTGN